MIDLEKTIQAIDWSVEPKNLYAPIGYTLESGGKRLRPQLLLEAFEMFSGQADGIENAALAVEIFHNFTLLHDDLMDQSPTRRGRPAVHKKWDANTAILSGDAMMIKAYEYLAKIPTKYWNRVFPVFTQTALEVCEGQQFDMDFEKRDDVCLEEYLKMIRLKTAVLLAGSLKIGAILADASEADIETIYKLGIALGLAFQIKDDYLDTYGSFELLGKRIGDDILTKKKTFLLISAFNVADNESKKELYLSLISEKTDEQKITEVTSIFTKLGVKESCEKAMNMYYNECSSLLAKISVSEERKAPIRALIERLQVREK